MNLPTARENADTLTQFQRAMQELRIEVIHANSPQAKGRVERLFQTLQDRLIKELRLNNISDIETANQFLKKKFIPAFNAKFAVEPRTKDDHHRPLSQRESNNLSAILCRQGDVPFEATLPSVTRPAGTSSKPNSRSMFAKRIL